MGFGYLDQIQKLAFWRMGEDSKFTLARRHLKCRCIASNLRSIGDALVARVRIDHFVFAMQQLGSRGEVMNVGGSANN